MQQPQIQCLFGDSLVKLLVCTYCLCMHSALGIVIGIYHCGLEELVAIGQMAMA